MIDLHIHFLPGVDDGAADLEESVAMCRLAFEDGCEALVATPHQQHPQWRNADRRLLESALEEVRTACGDRPQLYLGAEVRVDDRLLDAVVDLEHSQLIPLAGSRYLLLEFDVGVGPREVTELVHELRIGGWRPIIAHPEFVPALAGELEWMAKIAQAGALFQVTAMSLTGAFGGRTRRLTRRMLKAELVDFVASDGHRTDWRPPGLQQAFDEVASVCDREMAERVTTANPRAVLENQPIAAYGVA